MTSQKAKESSCFIVAQSFFCSCIQLKHLVGSLRKLIKNHPNGQLEKKFNQLLCNSCHVMWTTGTSMLVCVKIDFYGLFEKPAIPCCSVSSKHLRWVWLVLQKNLASSFNNAKVTSIHQHKPPLEATSEHKPWLCTTLTNGFLTHYNSNNDHSQCSPDIWADTQRAL